MSESYTPLYRKYRPQTFADIVGQETVVKTLSNAIKFDKVAHAYLFTGSRGTGKTSTARILAKSLNCVEGPTVTPCGKCPSCIDIANSSSIDVIEIDAASNRNVEDARNLIDKVHFMPVAGKYKVYIIDEVHMLTPAAFNTLLKTLEEPPKNLVFILATTESHKVLTTIISRCQKFDFRRVNQDLISARLKEIAKKENIKINDKAVSMISRRCHGGMRDALGLLDQISVLSSTVEEIGESDIISLIGNMPEDTLMKIADSFVDKDTGSLLKMIDEVSLTNEPVQVIRELINYFRNLLFVKTARDIELVKDMVDLSENILPAVKAQSEKFEGNEVVQIIEKLSECERTMKNSSQQLLWLEVGLIGICHRHDINTIKGLEERISKLEEALSSGTAPVVKPVSIPKPMETAKPVAAPEPKPEPVLAVSATKPELQQEPVQEEKPAAPVAMPVINLSDSWKALLEKFDSVPARSFFQSLSTPIEISPEKIVITFKNETFVKQAKDSGKLAPLEKAAEKLYGAMPRIIVRTPSSEDVAEQKKNESVEKAEKAQQISTALVEEVENIPKRGSQVLIDEKPVSDAEKEITEELAEIEPEVVPVNLSEQAKLVLHMFNGKVIDS